MTSAHQFNLRKQSGEKTNAAAGKSFNARNQKTRGLADSTDDDSGTTNSSTAPTQLAFGTELFQDTIYSEPVIAQNEAFSHAVIEGASSLSFVDGTIGNPMTSAHQFNLRKQSGEKTTIDGAAGKSFNARNQKTRGLADSTDDDSGTTNSSTAPTQLAFGTELFQDTIYSEPVIAQNEAFSHAVIEGARGRLKLQSNLSSTDPSESTFLDTNYHLGPPEVIQFEQNSTTSNWELVHYRYPWEPRS
eukprot:CAMPEP_0172473842 /NCGR_PEP_ID=MMETSP1065-20121228/69058_1 /TAXON_ID=265537 /ORGANISM="Amphiprora paludosa, Strain CCMP125" /LENGTH=244 /DNA_ID=CAMNT_0013232019 /DNA_START=646 /DNA_END=1377 /DNA_ORIENTATION=-